MTARRYAALVATLTAAVLGLAACTSIPSSGPVNEGDGVVSSSDPVVPIAEGPRKDDTPSGIVNGFVIASSAGFDSDFTVAREYLTSEAAATWDPTANVTVFDSGAVETNFDVDTNTMTYDVPVLATLDDSGRLTEAADGTRETLTFTLAQDSNDQWRIAELADGAILAKPNFERLFTPVSLIFASVDETTQVPELRWLPEKKAATLAARELVEGPSEALAPAVHTGFPAASALEVDSVIVTDGVAAVQLTAGSAGDAAQRSLAEQQMTLTLASIPGVRTVTVTVGGVALGGDNSADLAPAPLPGPDAAAFVNDRLGLWDGEDVWQATGDAGGLPPNSRGLAQSFDTSQAAWVVDDSRLVASSLLEDRVGSLEPYDEEAAAPTSQMETDSLYQGTNLVAPSADRHGWFWTTEVSDATELVAVTRKGEVTKLPVDWLRGTSVQGLSVSRDGARIVVLSQSGGKQLLEIASVVRGEDGTPLSVGDPVAIGADLGPAIDVTWVDDLTVAVLGAGGNEVPSELWFVEVGGLTTAMKSVTDAVDITAREQERSLVVVDTEHEAFTRSGAVWSKVATGPSELAYSG
ncbi:LpqB family beta-propeller domain-containing protein [Demequina sp.]|uniref:LpqB family beta-propeller domain-containing protein n=1 Tax=Demequina sp. TaxID=2050685 RepID=UPI003D15161C